MSRRYLGGFITANPTIPTASSASGSWTLSQQNQYASTWPFGGPFNYIEDVFSTYLYTGTGSNQTITNGIDLSGDGGLVWQKGRSSVSSNTLIDTVRGGGNYLISNTDAAQVNTTALTFSSTGFTTQGTWQNTNAETYASWTFREQAKFFDIVTYTGTGGTRTISHNLGSAPGMMIIKRTDDVDDWYVYHRSLGGTKYMILNNTTSVGTNSGFWNNTDPTSSVFSLGSATNNSGYTYVAYLFAHNAGGFGLSGNDNVISCGSFTTNATTGLASVNLGWEPQYVLIKSTSRSGTNWLITDNMRGMTTNSDNRVIYAELSNAETTTTTATPRPNSTGFSFNWIDGALGADTFIYMAIRRGPMKTPTSGTSVFSPVTSSATTGTVQTTGFPIDLQVAHYRVATYGAVWADRLRGVITTPTNATSPTLLSSDTSAESTALTATRYWDNTSFQTPTGWSGNSVAFWNFGRAPGFFDIVCYTGTGSATTVTHNLGVVPELMIVKRRSTSGTSWFTYSTATGNTNALLLDTTNAAFSATAWNNTTPTSSVFSLGTSVGVNGSGSTYVAYLFATLAGVSKVGSYAGTGATQTINCGFAGGARFVLIKRSNDAGGWYVWDTARGMVAGTDPFLALNTTDPETNLNTVYTIATGFQIVGTDPELNASGSTYIYLAIA